MYSGTSDKGHLCIKDTFRCTNLYSGNIHSEDDLSIMINMICPNVSVIYKFHCVRSPRLPKHVKLSQLRGEVKELESFVARKSVRSF